MELDKFTIKVIDSQMENKINTKIMLKKHNKKVRLAMSECILYFQCWPQHYPPSCVLFGNVTLPLSSSRGRFYFIFSLLDQYNKVEVTLSHFSGQALRDLQLGSVLGLYLLCSIKPIQPCGEIHVGENKGFWLTAPAELPPGSQHHMSTT